MTPLEGDAVAGLCRSVRLSAAADLVVFFRATQDGKARVLACAPHHALPVLRLKPPAALSSLEPLPAAGMQLPTALTHAVGGPVSACLFLLVEPDSWVLLLWREMPSDAASLTHLPALLPAFADLSAARGRALRAEEIHNQFEDLFESVPAGILLISGNGHEVQINEHAAGLLGGKSGHQPVADLQERMQRLRRRCDNGAELEAAYGALMTDVNFRSVLRWRLGLSTLEVDTHPVRGDGEHGRIWFFRDVTAEELMVEHLRRQAALDPLTGIPNRRHFEERSAQILAARETAGTGLAVLMFDIDHFKRINDGYGHAVGDVVLKEVARRGRGALRPHDLLARFGGEEFVALLPVSDEAEPRALAEAVRLAICGEEIALEDQSVRVSVSIGVAIGKSADRFSLELLTRHADEALYRAKDGGRNRVEIFSDEAA